LKPRRLTTAKNWITALLIQFPRIQRNKKSRRVFYKREKTYDLPLPVTPAGVHLFRRHRVDPRIADLIARLAGLGSHEVQA
jgi:hypothetical protein